MSRSKQSRVLLGLLVVAACASTDTGIEDGRDDRFLSAGKSDVAGIVEGSREALGVLRVVNESSRTTLVEGVGVSERVADAILAYRVGDDEIVGTADDEELTTLEELDAIPYVGPAVVLALLEYARSHGMVPDCASVCVDDTHAIDCDAGGATVACPLGCSDGVCQRFAPSNLVPETVREVYMQGVTASLTVPAAGRLEVDVDTGHIYSSTGTVLRPPAVGSAWGTPVFGVVDGIGYYDLDGLRVLVVKELKVGKGGTLAFSAFTYFHTHFGLYPQGAGWHVTNPMLKNQMLRTPRTRGVVILSLGPVTINGTVTAAGYTKSLPPYKVSVGGPGALGGIGLRNMCDLLDSGCTTDLQTDCYELIAGRPANGGYGQGPGAYGRPNLVPLLPGSGRYVHKQYGRQWATFCTGAGGGALEIVSLRSIEVAAKGGLGYAIINAGGTARGGSGGAILLEAPRVRIGPGGIVVANGGGPTSDANVLPTDADNGGGTLLTSPVEGGGGFGRIRINAGAEALDLEGAYISPVPSIGTPSLRDESDVVADDYTGIWSIAGGPFVGRIVANEVWGVEGDRRYVGRLEFGILKGWWTELPTRAPDADAGEFECRVTDVAKRVMTCRRRYGTNGTWTTMTPTYLGEERLGEHDAAFADHAAFVRHPWWP